MLTQNRSIPLTLLITLFAIFALASSVSALSHASGGFSRRDHTTLKRFVKKRADSSSTKSDSLLGPLIGAGATPPVISSDTNGTDTSSTNTTSSTSASTSTSTSAAISATNTTISTTSSTTISALTATSTNTTTTTASTSSSSSTTTTSSQTSQTSQAASSAPHISDSSSSVQFTLTQTQTAAETAVDASETSAAPSASNGGLSSSGKTTLVTVLIVVAVSVGALAIIWTVFRKWKLGSSKKFDQRLQPISWEPTVDDDVVPRRPSPDTASIRSGSEGHGAVSNLSRGLDHDFTAGPNHLAPIGGYADLARGPSPQPYMQEALSRGPSLTRPNYDASVPLHHQNSYGVQDTYGRY